MAYSDENRTHSDPQGEPIGSFDRDFADLKAVLGRMESASPADPIPEKFAEEPIPETSAAKPTPEKAPAEAVPDAEMPVIETPIPSDTTVRKDTEHTPRRNRTAKRTADKPRKKSRLPVIVIAIVLSAAMVAGIGYAVIRFLLPRGDGDTAATSAGVPVTISDSVMGDIELIPAKGAKINTYTEDNLVIDDSGIPAYYENGVKISHLGVDLSEYQGEVDFAAMKNAGAEFVMLRIGGRFYGESGGLYEDNAFDAYYEQAKAAGLKVGAYFFSQAASAEDAEEEANFALQKLGGRSLDYPIALDWENIAGDDARTDSVTGDMLTSIAETFCDTVAKAGYKAIVYSNTQQMFIMYDFETMKDYDFWLADYRDFPTMYYKFDMWQYTAEGSIDGVDGPVDLNISFTDFS